MIALPDPLRPYLALIRVALYVAVACVIFVGGCQHGKSKQQKETSEVQARYAAYQAQMVTLTQQVARANALAKQEYSQKSAEAARNYEDGRKSAELHQTTLVDDLRAGNLQLRNEWSSCMSSSHKNRVGPSAGSNDGAAAVPPEAFSRVLRVGDDADNQVTWLQAELMVTRKLAQSCGVAQ